jgi:hypothetical protein
MIIVGQFINVLGSIDRTATAAIEQEREREREREIRARRNTGQLKIRADPAIMNVGRPFFESLVGLMVASQLRIISKAGVSQWSIYPD